MLTGITDSLEEASYQLQVLRICGSWCLLIMGLQNNLAELT